MSSRPRRQGLPAYPCFLLSLVFPGLGQLAAGAIGRGLVLALLSGGVLAVFASGTVPPPWTDPADVGAWGLAALLAVIWISAPYDAWFRARERENDMLGCLPRTPRVAFLADAAWGGAGRVYLDGARSLPWMLPTVALAATLLLTGQFAVLLVLGGWNVAQGIASWSRAIRRYHATAAYAERQAALDAAPFASRRAPSPSLPFATMVAVFIAAMGCLFVVRTLQDLRGGPVLSAAGEVRAGRFISADRRVEMTLPDGWRLAAGVRPVLLQARRGGPDLTFTLAGARAALFREHDLVPYGALARFAGRQQAELAARLPEFRILSREPLENSRPGIRLVFFSTIDGEGRINVQDYLLARDCILVLTLSGAAMVGADELQNEMERLASGLTTKEPSL